MCKLQSDILTADTYKYQKKSCEDQFKFNKKMNATLKEAESCLDSSDDKSAHAKQRIGEGIELLAYRQKLVQMADSCEHGWRVVQEYTSNPLANDSEDDRKIMMATSRAERKAKVEKSRKKRPTPYSRPSTSADNNNFICNNSGCAKSARRPGVCYNCYKPGHWQFECPEKNKKLNITENEVWKHFEDCGEIENVRIIRDNKTGTGKGIGYIEFKENDGVMFALKFHESQLKGRQLRVMRCDVKAAQKQKEKMIISKERKAYKSGPKPVRDNTKLSFRSTNKKTDPFQHLSDRKNKHVKKSSKQNHFRFDEKTKGQPKGQSKGKKTFNTKDKKTKSKKMNK